MATHLGRRPRGFVIGLTGGPASGKTALAAHLRRRGAAYFSVDEAAHALYRPGRPAYRAILRRFGAALAPPGGPLDRGRLGRAVFGSPARLRALERLLHPALRREVPAALARLRLRHALTVVEAGPLLPRLGLLGHVDLVVWTVCGRARRARRLVADRGVTLREARRRLAAAAPAERELAKALRGSRKTLRVATDGSPARLAAAAAAIAARAEAARG